MKRITIFTAVAAAAVMLTASLATVGASASTVLCQQGAGVSHCEGEIMPAGTPLLTITNQEQDNETKFEVKTFLAPLRCGYSWFQAKSTAISGSPLAGETAFTYINPGSCKVYSGSSTCSATSMNKPPLTMEATGFNGDGKIYIGTALSPLSVSYTCVEEGRSIECTYTASASPVVMTVNNGSGDGYSRVKEAPLKLTGKHLNCSEKGTLNIVGVTGQFYEGEGDISFS